ncbi:MAG: type 4a pilus biogenesis protein PilO [bacterium]|nr:type 4a pilus biogenesis protein PilO [bacterium]
MTRPRRILFACVLVVVIFFAFFTVLFRPRAAQIRELNQKYAQVSKALERSKNLIERYKSVKVAFDSLSSQWEIFEEYLPEEKEMPGLLRGMAEAGRLSNVSFILFKPLTPVPREFYNENPIQIKVSAGYHELGNFLSRVAGLQRLVNVDKIRLMSSGKPDKTLEAEFIATAYSVTKKGR